MTMESANSLRRVLAPLFGAAAVPQVTQSLEQTMQKMVGEIREAVLAEVPAYSTSGNPEILPRLDQHSAEHGKEICRLFAGGGVGEFEFVKSESHRRAEQRFPLEAILHAYRCCQRILSLWLRQASWEVSTNNDQIASAVAGFATEYINIVSSIAAAEYVAHTRILAEAEGDRRTELLNILLSGYDESDARVAQLLKRAGYLEQRQVYCIVVAQSTIALEMENVPRAQRIVSAISIAMNGTPIRMLVGVRNDLVIAILADKRRQSGWTAPQSNLADRVRPMLLMLGPAVLVGVSADQPSTAYIPKAFHQARIALEFASVGNRVVQFSDLLIRDLLVHHGTEYMLSAPPNWVTAFLRADSKANGALLQTLRAIAQCNLNVQMAARLLGRHPNTLYARIERIKELTGLDGQSFRDLNELLLAADCWRS